MAFSNYGQLKAEINEKLFHQRFLSNYDSFTAMFEISANARLRVRQMEAVAALTTSGGEVALPTDYLTWRTIKPNAVTRAPWDELEYVHPAYLPPTTVSAGSIPRLFTIEGSTVAHPAGGRCQRLRIPLLPENPIVGRQQRQ